jgi:hypothetical protein
MIERVFTRYGWVKLNCLDIVSPRIKLIIPRKRKPVNQNERRFRAKFPDGAILISRHDDQKPDRVFYQIYSSIYDALRSRFKIKFRYGEKQSYGEWRDLTLNINSARLYLKKLLNYSRLNEKDKKEIFVSLEKLSEKLENKRNIFKEIAHDYIELSSEPEDSLGRINPSVKCNQLATGMRYLNLRLMEIPEISKFINQDQVILMQELDRHLFLCKDLYYRFSQVLSHQTARDPKRFSEIKYEKLELWIKKKIQDFGKMRVIPFTKTRAHAIEDLGEALIYAKEGKIQNVFSIFRKIKNSLRFKEAQFYLEEIVTKLTFLQESVDVNPSSKNIDWVVSRSYDLNNDLDDLVGRLNRILDDRGFKYRPKAKLLETIRNAEQQLISLKLEDAKELLKSASKLI